ncbi:MAG: hypothetical protein AAF206_27350, partial [Bacteroidota bacterium]
AGIPLYEVVPPSFDLQQIIPETTIPVSSKREEKLIQELEMTRIQLASKTAECEGLKAGFEAQKALIESMRENKK